MKPGNRWFHLVLACKSLDQCIDLVTLFNCAAIELDRINTTETNALRADITAAAYLLGERSREFLERQTS